MQFGLPLAAGRWTLAAWAFPLGRQSDPGVMLHYTALTTECPGTAALMLMILLVLPRQPHRARADTFPGTVL